MLVYLAGKVDRKTHLSIALVFGLAGYTTMLIIIGILSFMMRPGQPEWFSEGGYLNGFYGANTFAQLALRTAFMLTMTAVVGGIVASRIEDVDVKRRVLRVLAWLGIVSTVAGALLQRWHITTLPESALVVLESRMPAGYAPAMVTVSAVTLAWFVWTLVQPKRVHMAMASVMMVALLVLDLWPGETTRESIRKPFVAGQYVYSNQVIARDVPGMGIRSELPALEAHGFLKLHPFAPDALRQVDGSNLVEAGRFLALTTCSNCHSLTHTGMRPLARYFGGNTDVPALAAYLQSAPSTGNTMYCPPSRCRMARPRRRPPTSPACPTPPPRRPGWTGARGRPLPRLQRSK